LWLEPLAAPEKGENGGQKNRGEVKECFKEAHVADWSVEKQGDGG